MLLVGVPLGIMEPSMFDETDYGDDQDDEVDLDDKPPTNLRLLWERIGSNSGKCRWVSASISEDRILLVFDTAEYTS